MQRLAAFTLLFLVFAVPVHAQEEVDIQVRIFQTYLKQAMDGDANSQFIVASRYETGKGATRDLEKAYEWYEKAAIKGHPLAQRKVDERQPTKNPETSADRVAEKLAVAESQLAAKPPAAKPAPARATAPPTPKPVATKAPAPAPVSAPAVSAPAPAPTPAPAPIPSINIQQAILGGTWSRQQKPAEYLPSSRASCLPTNTSEVTCFSEDITRNVGSNGLTYTVKATLSGLDSRDGRFSLQYVYNVADVHRSPYSQASSVLADANDIAVRTGWQEPGVKLDCRLSDERSLTCTRTDRKGSFQYSRD